MNCNCIERINTKLKEVGHNYQLAPSMVFDDSMRLEVQLSVSTRWDRRAAAREEKPATAGNDLYLLPVLQKEDGRKQAVANRSHYLFQRLRR